MTADKSNFFVQVYNIRIRVSKFLIVTVNVGGNEMELVKNSLAASISPSAL